MATWLWHKFIYKLLHAACVDEVAANRRPQPAAEEPDTSALPHHFLIVPAESQRISS